MNRYYFCHPVLRLLNLGLILALLLAPLAGAAQATPDPLSTGANGDPLAAETPPPSSSAANAAQAVEDLGAAAAPLALGDDVLVNDPAGEATSMTQNGAVVAYNEDNGILCAAYTDSYHGVVQGLGFTGFSSSADGGATWVDRGALDASSFGDPSLAWRRADGHFYLASLRSNGLGLWDLGAGCSAATWVGMIHTGVSDDKEMLAVDNNPSSSYYGRLYTAWTDYTNGHIYVARSGDAGQIWSAPVDVSGHGQVNGAWPAVDPVTGDVYVAWTHWDVYPDGPIDVEMARSTDGGVTWTPLANPMSDEVNPRDATATSTCGRPALNGDIRYSPYPQIAVDRDGTLHAVYSYDPDGYNYNDVVNVYYRRSTDHGASWEAEIRVNDNWNATDQFFPALAVGETGAIGVFWYDRRLDSANNLLYDRYMAISRDGGRSFANQRISDESSPVTHDAALATCYHGDYDGAAAGGGYFYTVWGDDRRGDADVWSDSRPYFWGALSGTVYDANTLHGLPGAWVETVHATTGTPFSGEGDEGGYYELSVPGGETYTLTAQVYGYAPNTVTATVGEGGGQADVPLTPVASWSVSGQVTDANTGYPLRARIHVDGHPVDPPAPGDETWSDPLTGDYALPNLAAAVYYTLIVEAEGYISQTYLAGALTSDLTGVNFALQPDMAACTAPGYKLMPPCQAAAGVVLWPARLEAEGCPGAPQTHELAFANHTGADEEVLLSYTTSPGATLLDVPPSLGVVPNTVVQPFDVQVQIDRGVSLNTAVYATVTAYLASDPAISDTMVIEKRAALLGQAWEWEEDAPVAAFVRAAGATLDDAAYVIGGQNAGVASGDVARYRPGVGWETLGDKPTPAANIDAAELNGKIYVAGGYDGSLLSVFEVLDPARPAGSQWTTLAASLPVTTGGGAMAAACGKVYFMGGTVAGDAPTDGVYVYDPANPGAGWAAAASMPDTQRYASAVTARGLIFAVGDWATGTRVQVYDCVANTWLSGYPQLTVGRQSPGTAVVQDRYVVAYGGGGMLWDGYPDVEVLDLDNLAAGWQAGPSMSQGRMGPGGGVAGGRLIAAGGNDASAVATNSAESIAICTASGCGVALEKDASAEWVYPGERVTYTVVITQPAWLTGTVELVDTLPASATFAGYVGATDGTAWYSPTAHAVYWTRPAGAYSAAGVGNELEVFTNTWADDAVGLVYNPESESARYVHEGSGPRFIHDVDYLTPHAVRHSFNLSEMNPAWPTTQDWRSGAGYDYATGHYFLTDYGGGGAYSDNIVEIDPAGRVLNAWETDGADNDSYDGSALDDVMDIAVVPGTPPRYFATRLFDGNEIYEVDLVKKGQFVASTWGTVTACTVPGITDTAGIDYDAQNGVLYHSDWDSNAIVATDLACHVIVSFTCGASATRNSGVTFVEGQWPPEVWALDSVNNTTTRCRTVGREPAPEVVTVTYAVQAAAPVSTTLVNQAVLACDAPGCVDPSALSILHLRTTNTAASVQRALGELGYAYDVTNTVDWAGLDFSPYDVVVVGMTGGSIGVASIQKIRTDVIDRGKRVVFVGGSYTYSFVDGVNQYLVANDTTDYAWVQTAAPHFTLVDPAHPLARGLPASRDFVSANARRYQLRVTDPTIELVAQNGDGYASYFRKTYPGGGELVWFIHSALGSYWTDPVDFQLLRRIVANALAGPRYVADAAVHVAPRAAITWTKEIYVNGNYAGQHDEGPFTVTPGDDVQLVDRLDTVGVEPLFVQLTEDWAAYPVMLTDEYHTRGVVTPLTGDWSVTLLPGASARLVKTLHITASVPVAIHAWLHPDGMPSEERLVAFRPPAFAKDGPAVAYYDQVIPYTLTLESQDPLLGSLRLTDTLPAGVEYVGNLNASYGDAWYSAVDNAVYWTNAPAASLTRRAALSPALGDTPSAQWAGASPAPTLGPLSTQNTPAATGSVSQSRSPGATWFDAARLPRGLIRYAHAQCPGDPNRFYVITGIGGGGSSSADVWRYDAGTDAWTALAPFPSPGEGPSAVCYQGRIYVAGGTGGMNDLYIYDIVRDTWSAGPSLPRRVWGAAMGAWDGRLFLAGGDDDVALGGASNQVNIYDIAAENWDALGAPMPATTFLPGWAQVGQYLYVVGGWGSSAANNVTATQRYDMASDSWESGPTFTSGRGDFALAATGHYLYAIGGDADGGGIWDAVTLVERLDYTNWSSATWADVVDPLPVALTAYGGGFCTAAKAGGEIWSVGGLTPGFSRVDSNQYRPSEPCVTIPPTVTLTFNARVTAGAGERVTNTAELNWHGHVLDAASAFELPLTLTVNLVGNGSVTRSPSQTVYVSGTLVYLVALADPGWTFNGWSGDCSTVPNTGDCELAMTSSRSVTATFVPRAPLTVTLPVAGPGSYDWGTICGSVAFTNTGGTTQITVTLAYTHAGHLPGGLERRYTLWGNNTAGFEAAVTLCYEQLDLDAAHITDETQLHAYRYLGAQTWYRYSRVDPAANTVTADGVSDWGVFGLGVEGNQPTAVTLRGLHGVQEGQGMLFPYTWIGLLLGVGLAWAGLRRAGSR